MTAFRIAFFVLLLAAASFAHAAEDNPDVAALLQRLQSLDASAGNAAAYERLQARQAIDALAMARSSQRVTALQVAQLRVETAETAARDDGLQQQIGTLERSRNDLLVEASRQDAARARQESERLRVQAQIQAEETARIQEQVTQEATARQEAETALSGVADDQTAKLKAARQREAELTKREAELTGGAADKPGKKKAAKKKP